MNILQNILSRLGAVHTLFRGEANLLRVLLVLATLLLVVGLVTPMMTISKFVVLNNSFSVLSGIIELLAGGQYLLFIIIAGFSIVMPFFKLHILFKLVNQKYTSTKTVKRYLHLMHDYGRWAMLDVLVVAVLIVTVKLGAIVSIQVHSGLYFFGASVVLIMYITHRVVALMQSVPSVTE